MPRGGNKIIYYQRNQAPMFKEYQLEIEVSLEDHQEKGIAIYIKDRIHQMVPIGLIVWCN